MPGSRLLPARPGSGKPHLGLLRRRKVQERGHQLGRQASDRLEQLRRRDKTVVLTGAMVPYKFGSSDGLFNLGSALAFVQTLPHGVYIAMNGRCFPWHSVRKNRALGVFEGEPLREK